jgi:hypothetical protein
VGKHASSAGGCFPLMLSQPVRQLTVQLAYAFLSQSHAFLHLSPIVSAIRLLLLLYRRISVRILDTLVTPIRFILVYLFYRVASHTTTLHISRPHTAMCVSTGLARLPRGPCVQRAREPRGRVR